MRNQGSWGANDIRNVGTKVTTDRVLGFGPMRPLIGVTTSVSVGQYPERAYVNASYLLAVQGAGGIPVLLPPQLEPAQIDSALTALG